MILAENAQESNERIRWFGPEPWSAGVCKWALRDPIPTGVPCMHCHSPIKETDRGVMIYDTSQLQHRPTHLKCLMKNLGISDEGKS
jgi:hypothetical protein